MPKKPVRQTPAQHEAAPSKTAQKQMMHDLQKLGEELVALNANQLSELDLPESLYIAVTDAQRIQKFGARRRQLQYIGKIMRQIDATVIQEKLMVFQQRHMAYTALLHRTERWREKLLADPQAVDVFAGQYPATDRQQLRALLQNIQTETQKGKPGKSTRQLFQFIHRTVLRHDKDCP